MQKKALETYQRRFHDLDGKIAKARAEQEPMRAEIEAIEREIDALKKKQRAIGAKIKASEVPVREMAEERRGLVLLLRGKTGVPS